MKKIRIPTFYLANLKFPRISWTFAVPQGLRDASEGKVAYHKNVLYLSILQLCFYEESPEMNFNFDPPAHRVDP